MATGNNFLIRSSTHNFSVVHVHVVLVRFYTVGVVEQLDILAPENIVKPWLMQFDLQNDNYKVFRWSNNANTLELSSLTRPYNIKLANTTRKS